ncbi:DNA repair protein RAD50 [Grifola frondosa]|uniref:DNA repair protein RAD50 n=1 Tax=Grifola frondosa TaxID=5627 RepID=A0A1C7M525_GRIFR|nr:DNA repair protein RAD50 [Grifola frondosa]
MASLNKLAIRGIRSFDDKQISVIEFFTPVTVIVGHNGSGKTTIIECLKYATTGDQPPNTRGGAFVHDPKMANEKEVKAQVKLRFHAANGARMLAVRNLSVTMKKNGALTMKTLESILALADGNADKGGKCAEMDAEIPQLLGVSKAVLENVIFCHQEDSYWPLSEPSVLKKKFDDIFEATKYTKALDSIKALRKDRVAELKAEDERLQSLAREKQHADKLKARETAMSGTIAEKEIEYDQMKAAYHDIVKANQKLSETGTKFRETYLRAENLNKEKQRYQEELEAARENLQELAGTNEELAARLQNFDDHIVKQKQKWKSEKAREEDVEDDLSTTRKAYIEANNYFGQLQSEEKAQEQRISDREALIRNICAQHHIVGYEHTPLERETVLEFITKLNDLSERQNRETSRLETDRRVKSDEYNTKSTKLHSTLGGYKQQRSNLQDRWCTTLQGSISSAEHEIDAGQNLTSELKTLQADIDEKQHRLEKMQTELRAANFEERLAEKASKTRSLDLKREELNAELRTLSSQADSRAKLDLQRESLKARTSEVKTILDIHNPKFRKLVGMDINPDTMLRELERVSLEKDREHADLENQSNVSSHNLQTAQTVLSNLKAQIKAKQEEIKAKDRQLKVGLQEGDFEGTVEEAVASASSEISVRNEELGKHTGTQSIYQRLLATGKNKKCCPLCMRDMDEEDMDIYEGNVKDLLKKSSPQAIRDLENELKEWDLELKRLQELAVVAASRETLRSAELPALEQQIKEKEAEIPGLTEKAEQLLNQLNEVNKELKDISAMRQQALLVANAQHAIERLKYEISSLENILSSTGSTRTADGVQAELDVLAGDIRINEREKQNIMADRERQTNATRSQENDLHRIQLRESQLKNQMQARTALEQRVEEMRQEISVANAQIKDLDAKIKDASDPIDQLDREWQAMQQELAVKISQAQQASQEFNKSVDQLDRMNRAVEDYVKKKRGRLLREVAEKIEEQESTIKRLETQLEEIRSTINGIDKEINEAGASVANLRENIRVRKLAKDIADTQAELDSVNMEEAAKAKRIYDAKWEVEKQKETDLQTKYARIGGELSALKAQLKTLEEDSKEFKNVHKQYRDQLIKVKMSTMANDDLEKYAKALDNAIMKYHSLKMEEVNDTMRHLWNKTYQGTDIDGIKISSDSDGGATRRTYNYRVVMTKDQVEMDMRGRCSAGQKMLASIIIRLALADSFGQNCGILALDEPTNALDMENIDALAASLVDIINERKNNANFQLIIITHDENFLRKLGQSDVMEYYWRVTRDSRQKSIIERHRFG